MCYRGKENSIFWLQYGRCYVIYYTILRIKKGCHHTHACSYECVLGMHSILWALSSIISMSDERSIDSSLRIQQYSIYSPHSFSMSPRMAIVKSECVSKNSMITRSNSAKYEDTFVRHTDLPTFMSIESHIHLT